MTHNLIISLTKIKWRHFSLNLQLFVTSADTDTSPANWNESESEDKLLHIGKNSSMEQIMTELLQKLKIDNAIWHLSRNTNFYQITFAIESNFRHELVLNVLNDWGIGQRNGSSMSMIPCAIHNEVPYRTETDLQTESINDQKQTAWNRFMSSIRARWNVARIVQQVRDDATLTFDFVTLVFVAGWEEKRQTIKYFSFIFPIIEFRINFISNRTLASFGLVENSTILMASSMLISPLMVWTFF